MFNELLDKVKGAIGNVVFPQREGRNAFSGRENSRSVLGDFLADRFGKPPAEPQSPIQAQTQGAQAAPTQAPTPTPTPEQSQYRLLQWDNWKNERPKDFEQLLAGATQASDETGVPIELLMDVSGLEAAGQLNAVQKGGGPARGPFQFEMNPDGSLMHGFDNLTRKMGMENFDPHSATDSARLAATAISNPSYSLSRWGVPKANWGTLDNQRRPESQRLINYYNPEELNQYLPSQYHF